MSPSGRAAARVAVTAIALAGCADAGTADWPARFEFGPQSVHQLRAGELGLPYLPVTFGDDTLWLPFDTGNMVGLTLASRLFEALGLPCDDSWELLDSAGEPVSTDCIARGVRAGVCGRTRDSVDVFEFHHESLPGLVGPDALPGDRLMIDYGTGRLAVDDGPGPKAAPGFAVVPLTRSARHPRLILVEGSVNGRPVLIEIDTGKSRTTVDRALVEALNLRRDDRGVRVGTVRLGPLTFEVESAREVDTSGISEGLPTPISLGIGSDNLRRFVWGVDYSAGKLWLPQELPTP